MLFRQFVDEDLGCASYLVGDAESGEAVLVDPAYAVEQYLDAANEEGVRIVRVLETHTHADHVSGHGRLALEHGIPVSVHPAAEAAFDHDPLEDGEEVAAGSLRVRCLHTPGHRPEHCCFLVATPEGSAGGVRSPALATSALLTGDSLFVGAVARPDLAVEAREGAEGLFHSLNRLMELPDDVRVFPGHVAGSLCGTGMSSDPSSTIGAERRGNSLLALATVQDFVDEATGTAVPRPPNMGRIVDLNRGPFLAAQPPLEPVADAGNATVLDVRHADDFAAGHVPGALNVPVSGGSFGTKSGFVLRPGEPVVLHASSPEEAELAAMRLRAVGFLELAGYLVSPQATETTQPVEVTELDALRASERRADPRRPRARRARRRLHPGQPPHPVPAAPRRGGGRRRREEGRDDLRERPARGDRGERAGRSGRRRAPRAARRDQRVAAPRRPHGRVQALRLVASSDSASRT